MGCSAYGLIVLVGELRVMFAQEDVQSGYMDRFFAENPNTAISWIHDLGKGRHEAAAAALLHEAEQATNLETKHVGNLFLLKSDSTETIHVVAHAKHREIVTPGAAA
jgi:hypothetical protein